jgi:UbiD family decarboxylase
MAYSDLRSWLEDVEKMGELKRIEGAHWDKEIGGLSELLAERDPAALLFDKIPGYPEGFRVLSNCFLTHKRTASVLGIPQGLGSVQMVDAWRKRLKNIKMIPPVTVKDGPILQNVLTGTDVDLYKFPTPIWHEKDGGRFIGTGCAVVTKDIEEGWVNLGTYRCRIFDKNHISLSVNPGKHGTLMMEKYHSRGKPFPIALVCGLDPVLFLAACSPYTGVGESEYDFAGGIMGEAVKVIPGPITGLPIPATAEIVLEGEIPPPPKMERREDGPFGEWSRYYATTSFPVVEIKSMLYRNNPILMGVPPLKNHIPFPFSIPVMASEIWNVMEYAGIPDIKGVWFGLGLVWPVYLVISIKQSYYGHAKQAALAGASCRANTVGGKFVIVVDDDIDITNEKDVMLAVAGRANMDNVQVISGIMTKAGAPKKKPLPGEETQLINDRVLIDATVPYERRKNFPVSTAFSTQYIEDLKKKWAKLL